MYEQIHWEGNICAMIFKPGNLPVIGTRRNSRSRVIDRTVNKDWIVFVASYSYYGHLLRSILNGVFCYGFLLASSFHDMKRKKVV